MLTLAVSFFALAALLGFYLLSFVLTNKPTPKGVAFTHGPLAVIGLIILIAYAIFHPHQAPLISIIIFILAAMGGLILIFRDLTGKSVPKGLAIGHGLTALIAFICLLVFIF